MRAAAGPPRASTSGFIRACGPRGAGKSWHMLMAVERARDAGGVTPLLHLARIVSRNRQRGAGCCPAYIVPRGIQAARPEGRLRIEASTLRQRIRFALTRRGGGRSWGVGRQGLLGRFKLARARARRTACDAQLVGT
jgi:hypothetical protein